ncbi:MAG: hypothetical protein E7K47_17035, partial [Acidovorax sp.]|nr:hypothetical protein [Acidovorax sp.]
MQSEARARMGGAQRIGQRFVQAAQALRYQLDVFSRKPPEQRLLDRLAVENACGLELQGALFFGLNRAKAVNRLTQG